MPVSGSGTTRHASPKTSRTRGSVTTEDGGPSATIDAGAHGDQVRGVPGGLVEVVQHGDERAPLLVQARAQVHDLELVGDVEERGRLVEQQQVGLLRERHGQPDPLPLTAGELGDEPVAQVGDLGAARASATARASAADHCRSSPWCG